MYSLLRANLIHFLQPGKLFYLVLVLLVFVLSACTGGGEEDDDDDEPSSIELVDIIGNLTPLSGTVRTELGENPINDWRAARMDLTWQVSSSDPFFIRAYISSNTILEEGVDEKFLDVECGSNNLEFSCAFTSLMVCRFVFEPIYIRVLVLDDEGDPIPVIDPLTGEQVTDPETGDPVFKTQPATDINGVRIIDEDYYALRCPAGGTTTNELDITSEVVPSGTAIFPYATNILFSVCNRAGSCETDFIPIEFYDIGP